MVITVMKSATISLKLYSLVLIFTFAAFLIFATSKAFAQTLEHHAVCEAIYINGTGIPNGGTYKIKSHEKFHAEIKMKNLGQKPWRKDQNYKLGIGLDPSDSFGRLELAGWPFNRVEIPNNNPVNLNQNITFSFDANSGAAGLGSFYWQMLKERQVDSAGNVTDAGGRFGEVCKIAIDVVDADSTTTVTPAVPNTAPTLSFPFQATPPQTICVNSVTDTERIAANWRKNDGVGSLAVVLRENRGAIGFSGCLPPTVTTNTFSKEVSTTGNYAVSFALYADNNCSRLITTQEVPVVNGFQGAISNGWQYQSVEFLLKAGSSLFLPLNTCKPLAITLPSPTTASQEIPIKIKPVRSKYSAAGTTNELRPYEYTVKFKYQPPTEGGSK